MPRKLIKDRAIVEDSFTLVESLDALPESGDILVDISLWADAKSQLKGRNGKLGVRLLGQTEPEEIADDIAELDLIAVEFPAFKDGRGYSLARLLRERFGFTGELRATGDVLRDQLFYLMRCGFNSFATREDRDIEDALNGLSDFSVTYQADVNEKKPIYQRRS